MDHNRVSALLEEGWAPRIKTVKGHKYITLRKGRRETSLGPYNEELWNQVKIRKKPTLTPEEVKKLQTLVDGNTLDELGKTIEAQTTRIANLENELQAFSPYLEAVRYITAHGEWKAEVCKHRNVEGYCMRFHWEKSEPPYFKKIILPHHKSPNIDYKRFAYTGTQVRYWRIRSQYWVCGLCGLYESRDADASNQNSETTI